MDNTDTQTYRTLEDIEKRMAQLQREIEASEKRINSNWNKLFHEKKKPLVETPTQKLTRYISLSSGVIDGALLGWKLYRRFKK